MGSGKIPTWVFRLQHRLSMTHNEFLAVSVAVALFVGGEVARHFIDRGPVYGPEFYSRRDSLFFALSTAGQEADTTVAARVDSVQADTTDADDSQVGSPASAGRIDVNRASIAELVQLPGIGPRLAERIISHRERHGPFRRVRDLQNVSGIGPRKLEALAPLVVVGF